MLTVGETWIINGVRCDIYDDGRISLVDTDGSGDMESYDSSGNFVATTCLGKELYTRLGLTEAEGNDMAVSISVHGRRYGYIWG